MSQASTTSEVFYAERLRVHCQRRRLDLTAKMMWSTAQVMEWHDRTLEQCVGVLADMLKGETTDETRETSQDVFFEVFQTWWDHLKYDLKEGRLFWLPAAIKRRIQVRYLKIKRVASVVHPVKIIRACPHPDVDFTTGMGPHLRFLFPSRFEVRSEE
jgi:hypothetical protein